MSENKPRNSYRGRLAPTPSGYLHEGHILTFRIAWERAKGGAFVFRMDDLDPDRCTQEYAQACINDIKGMGVIWNEGVEYGGSFGPYLQSAREEFYLEALYSLLKLNMIYPCFRTRKEIRSAGLVSRQENEYLYPENWSPRKNNEGLKDFPGSKNWRFRTKSGDKINFHDKNKDLVEYSVGSELSDFIVWRKDGIASYELATVVDDYRMHITEVVRGEDLLISSARQCMLYDALGWKRPDFYHCELLTDNKGNKLSKSSRNLPRLFPRSE